MDPLSITASVLGISTVALKITKSLSDLVSRYRYASLTITAICSETAIINAALSQIQSLLFKNGSSIVDKFEQRRELCSTFDVAVTGCQLLFSCLEEEVGTLISAVNVGAVMGRKDKMKAAWKEDVMNTLLGQLRGQAAALNLLLQGLQMESVSDVQKLMRRHGKVLAKIEETTQSLRKAYPRNHVPESILESSRSPESIFDSETSTIGGAEFTFDDVVINSKAYRRAFSMAQLRNGRPSENTAQAAQGNGPPTQSADIRTFTNVTRAATESFKWHAPSHFQANSRWDPTQHSPLSDWQETFGMSNDHLLACSKHAVRFAKAYWDLFTGLRYWLELMHIMTSALLNPKGRLHVWDPKFSLFMQYMTSQTAMQVYLYDQLLWSWQKHGAWNQLDAELFDSFLDLTGPLHLAYVRELPKLRRELQQGLWSEVVQFLEPLLCIDKVGEDLDFFLRAVAFGPVLEMEDFLEKFIASHHRPSDIATAEKTAHAHKRCKELSSQFDDACNNAMQ